MRATSSVGGAGDAAGSRQRLELQVSVLESENQALRVADAERARLEADAMAMRLELRELQRSSHEQEGLIADLAKERARHLDRLDQAQRSLAAVDQAHQVRVHVRVRVRVAACVLRACASGCSLSAVDQCWCGRVRVRRCVCGCAWVIRSVWVRVWVRGVLHLYVLMHACVYA